MPTDDEMDEFDMTAEEWAAAFDRAGSPEMRRRRAEHDAARQARAYESVEFGVSFSTTRAPYWPEILYSVTASDEVDRQHVEARA